MAGTDPISIRLSDLEQTSAELDYVEKVKSTGVIMQCPVRLGFKQDGSDLWTIPLEPIVHAKGVKTIIRRNLSKPRGQGSIKEQWNIDDYLIRLEGTLQGNVFFPEEAVSKLQSFFVAGQSIQIRAKLLDVIGVSMICIESVEYTGTPGLENQRYLITAYSDQFFDLLVTN
ncbi:DUF6046 domain-containing protein [Spirosoma aerolatum]|uniref:DUF6046 domain-containing protein n=1 Tax=Spirosoma aerolatum TaxID=1211326 RepID=UPI0009ACD19B|nr:DUF6046 domain-containing protein [Spirosoma aerolatum]